MYRLSLFFYRVAIGIAAFFGNSKARLWIKGRRRFFEQLQVPPLAQGKTKTVWLHCASLGEFEQGRPVVESLLQRQPEYRLILTFFSPSGYQIRKNYSLADAVWYLPMDSPRNAQRFIDAINPDTVIFVKYEFWYYYLQTLYRRSIPTFLISAIFRPQQSFFRWYGGFFRQMLGFFKHIFVQNQSSSQLLHSIGIKHHSIVGDTRLDRVLAICHNPADFPLLQAFKTNDNTKILMCGSTWLPDEQLIIAFWTKHLQTQGWRLAIAPHEIHESHLKSLEMLLPLQSFVRYTQATTHSAAQAPVLIIDTIGILSQLYRYADVAYIGGGFGKGIHNTLEAAVYGIPVLFAPKYHKFAEAVALIERGAAFCVSNYETFLAFFDMYLSPTTKAARIRHAALSFFDENKGATDKILALILNIDS